MEYPDGRRSGCVSVSGDDTSEAPHDDLRDPAETAWRELASEPSTSPIMAYEAPSGESNPSEPSSSEFFFEPNTRSFARS